MKKVLAFGTFDILHLGHIYFLKKAKKLGKELIVVIARDENVKRIKGKKPLHNEKERAEILKALKFVDKVVLGDKKNFFKKIIEINPDIIALGYDQKVNKEKLEEAIKSCNKKIKIIRIGKFKDHKYKTSKIKERIRNE